MDPSGSTSTYPHGHLFLGDNEAGPSGRLTSQVEPASWSKDTGSASLSAEDRAEHVESSNQSIAHMISEPQLTQDGVQAGTKHITLTPEQRKHKRYHQKNMDKRNGAAKVVRELEKTLHGDSAPSASAIKQREYRAARKQREEAEVEAFALLNPDAPRPLTRQQLRDKKRNKEFRDASNAKRKRAKIVPTSAHAPSLVPLSPDSAVVAHHQAFDAMQLSSSHAVATPTVSHQAAKQSQLPAYAEIERLLGLEAANSLVETKSLTRLRCSSSMTALPIARNAHDLSVLEQTGCETSARGSIPASSGTIVHLLQDLAHQGSEPARTAKPMAAPGTMSQSPGPLLTQTAGPQRTSYFPSSSAPAQSFVHGAVSAQADQGTQSLQGLNIPSQRLSGVQRSYDTNKGRIDAQSRLRTELEKTLYPDEPTPSQIKDRQMLNSWRARQEEQGNSEWSERRKAQSKKDEEKRRKREREDPLRAQRRLEQIRKRYHERKSHFKREREASKAKVSTNDVPSVKPSLQVQSNSVPTEAMVAAIQAQRRLDQKRQRDQRQMEHLQREKEGLEVGRSAREPSTVNSIDVSAQVQLGTAPSTSTSTIASQSAADQ